MAAAIGMMEESEKQSMYAEKVRSAFLEKWLLPDGTVCTGSQACYAFSLWLGILPENVRGNVAAKMNEAVKKAGRITTGNLCTLYLFEMLSEYGYIDTAWELITSDEYPSLGYMIKNGATTVWERFELKKDPGMNSHCHPMYGSVGAWMFKYLVGIKPVSPGFSRVSIKPNIPIKLTYAEATVDTCRGDIHVKWQKSYGDTQLFVTVPFGVEADIYLPNEVKTVGSGFYKFILD
jgi:alpha-L-rhamnosidase